MKNFMKIPLKYFAELKTFPTFASASDGALPNGAVVQFG